MIVPTESDFAGCDLAGRHLLPFPLSFRCHLPAALRPPPPVLWTSTATMLGRPELPDIVRQTDQHPLPTDLLQTPQQKMPEAAALFDLSKDRLHNCLASGIEPTSPLGP